MEEIKERHEKVSMAEYATQNISARDQTVIPQNGPGRDSKALKTCPFSWRTILSTSRHRKNMSSGVHGQESSRIWSRSIDPRPKEMYMFYFLGKCPMTSKGGMSYPFLLVVCLWRLHCAALW